MGLRSPGTPLYGCSPPKQGDGDRQAPSPGLQRLAAAQLRVGPAGEDPAASVRLQAERRAGRRGPRGAGQVQRRRVASVQEQRLITGRRLLLFLCAVAAAQKGRDDLAVEAAGVREHLTVGRRRLGHQHRLFVARRLGHVRFRCGVGSGPKV